MHIVTKKSILQACEDYTNFCCSADGGVIQLKQGHHYFFKSKARWQPVDCLGGIFFVWTGNDHFFQHVPIEESFWNDTLLSKLLAFYITSSALLYLNQREGQLPTSQVRMLTYPMIVASLS